METGELQPAAVNCHVMSDVNSRCLPSRLAGSDSSDVPAVCQLTPGAGNINP